VSYNRFQNKATAGAFIVLDEDNITFRPYVHHNHLRNHTYEGANGGEAIRVFSVLPRIEQNLLEDIHVHGEFISMKESGASQGGFYRYNTFRNITNGDLTFRFCRNDVVEGNFFLNTPGMRVYGKNHKIRNNYMEGGRIMLGDGSTTGTYVGIDNLELSFNTLVNARIAGSLRADTGIAPANLRIANNIIVVDDGVAMAEPRPFVNVTYEGNILWGTAEAGAMPASGYARVDPKLVRDGDGIYHLAASSPAIDAAMGSYTLADDLDGQSRSGAKDVGADEASTTTVTRRPLGPSDVGPQAGLATPTPTPTATSTRTPTPTPGASVKLPVPVARVTASTHDGNVPGNTVDGSLSTRWSALGDGQWIQYDLGATKTVTSVKLAWFNGSSRVATFDVLVGPSSTGPWTAVATGRTSTGTTTGLETHDVTDTSGRHVRIVGHGNTLNAWNSLTEVEIWGR
jgi:hypothetical protein